MQYTVALDSAPSEDTTLDITASGDGAAAVYIYPTQLAFTTSDWSIAQTVNVLLDCDGVAPQSGASVTTVLSHTLAAGVGGGSLDITATHVDDSVEAVATYIDGDISEGNSALLTILLGSVPQESIDAVVSFSKSQAAAETLVDNTGPHTFDPDAVDYTGDVEISILIDDDDIDFGDRNTHTVSWTVSPSGAYFSGSGFEFTVVDDDTAGVTSTPDTSDLWVEGEYRTSGSWDISLDTQPTQTVIISATLPSGWHTEPQHLSFTSSNWQVDQSFALVRDTDDIVSATAVQTITATVTVASVDLAYDAMTFTEDHSYIDDDFESSFVVRPTGEFFEGEGYAASAGIGMQPDGTGSIDIDVLRSGVGSVGLAAPASMDVTPDSWHSVLDFTFTVFNDHLASEGLPELVVSLSTDDSVVDGHTHSVTLDLVDDDFSGAAVVGDGDDAFVVIEGSPDPTTATALLASEPTCDDASVSVDAPDSATGVPGFVGATTAALGGSRTWVEPIELEMYSQISPVAWGAANKVAVDVSTSCDSQSTHVASLLWTVVDLDYDGFIFEVPTLVEGPSGTAVSVLPAASPPSGDSHNLAVSSSSIAADPPTLTVTDSDWTDLHDITLFPADDDTYQASSSELPATFALTGSSGSELSAVLNFDSIDDDFPGLSAWSDSGLLVEGGADSRAPCNVMLASALADGTSVTLNRVPDGLLGTTDKVFVDSTVVIESSTSRAAVPFTAIVFDDNVATEDSSVELQQTLTTTASEYAAFEGLASAATVRFTLIDDDYAGLSMMIDPVVEGVRTEISAIATAQPLSDVAVSAAVTSALTWAAAFGATIASTDWLAPATVVVTADDDETASAREARLEVSAAWQSGTVTAPVALAVVDDDFLGAACYELSWEPTLDAATVAVIRASDNEDVLSVVEDVPAGSPEPSILTFVPSEINPSAGVAWEAPVDVSVFLNPSHKAFHLSVDINIEVGEGSILATMPTDVTGHAFDGITMMLPADEPFLEGQDTALHGAACVSSSPGALGEVVSFAGTNVAISPATAFYSEEAWDTVTDIEVFGVEDDIYTGDSTTVAMVPEDNSYADAVSIEVVRLDNSFIGLAGWASVADVVEAGDDGIFRGILAVPPGPESERKCDIEWTSVTSGLTLLPFPQQHLIRGGEDWARRFSSSIRYDADYERRDATTATFTVSCDFTSVADLSVPLVFNIHDIDFTGVAMIVAEADLEGVTEDGETVTAGVFLASEPTAEVSITMEIAPDEAEALPVTATPDQVDFDPQDPTWSDGIDVVVSLDVDDQIAWDGHNTQEIWVSTAESSGEPPAGYDGLTTLSLSFFIVDNDEAALVAPGFDVKSDAIDPRAYAPIDFPVHLNSEPLEIVSVVATEIIGDRGRPTVQVVPPVLEFSSSTWEVDQVFEIHRLDDDFSDTGEVSQIRFDWYTSELVYSTLSNIDVSVRLDDDDTFDGVSVVRNSAVDVIEGETTDLQLLVASLHGAPFTLGLSSPALTQIVPAAISPDDDWQAVNSAVLYLNADHHSLPRSGDVVASRFGQDLPGMTTVALPVDIADDSFDGLAAVRKLEFGVTEGVFEAEDSIQVFAAVEPEVHTECSASWEAEPSPLGAGLVPLPSSHTFSPSDWTAPFVTQIHAFDDLTLEGTHDSVVDVECARLGETSLGAAVDVEVSDDEFAAVAVLTAVEDLSVQEDGTPVPTMVTIGSLPTSEVVVEADVDPHWPAATAFTARPASVRFEDNDMWWNPQMIELLVENDDDIAWGPLNLQTVTFSSTDVTSDYDGRETPGLEYMAVDNDAAGLDLTGVAQPVSVSLLNGGLLSVTLQSQPINNVTIVLKEVLPDGATRRRIECIPPAIEFEPSGWNIPRDLHIVQREDFFSDSPMVLQVNLSTDTVDLVYLDMPDVVVDVALPEEDVFVGHALTWSADTLVLEGSDVDGMSVITATKPTGDSRRLVGAIDDGRAFTIPPVHDFSADTWTDVQPFQLHVLSDSSATVELSVDASVHGSDLQTPILPIAVVDDAFAGASVQRLQEDMLTEAAAALDLQFTAASQPAPGRAAVCEWRFPPPGGLRLESFDSKFSLGDANGWDELELGWVAAVGDSVAWGIDEVSVSATCTFDEILPLNLTIPAVYNDDDFHSAAWQASEVQLFADEAGAFVAFAAFSGTQPTGAILLSFSETARHADAIDLDTMDAVVESASWDAIHEIAIAGMDDDIFFGELNVHDVELELAGSVSLATPSMAMTVVDNDEVGLNVTQADAVLTEATPAVPRTYNLSLYSEPLGDVVVVLQECQPLVPGVYSPNGVPDFETLCYERLTDGELPLEHRSQVTWMPQVLVFSRSNWSIPQIVSVAAVDDDIDDLQEFEVYIDHMASSSEDQFYNSLTPAEFTAEFATFVIADNDDSHLKPSALFMHALEGFSSWYLIELNSQPTRDVHVEVTVVSLVPTNAPPVVVEPQSVTFTMGDWDSPRNMTITPVDDSSYWNMDTLTQRIDHAVTSEDPFYFGGNGHQNGLHTQITVEVRDNDQAELLWEADADPIVLYEGEEGEEFRVRLLTPPSADVTVQFDVRPARINFGEVIITPEVWDLWTTVVATAVDDDVQRKDSIDVVMSMTTSSEDERYDFLDRTGGDMYFVIYEDDVAGLLLTTQVMLLSEADGDTHEGAYSVRLLSQPREDVNISISFDANQVAVDDPLLVFTDNNWNVLQEVTVTAVNDGNGEDGFHDTEISHVTASLDAKYRDREQESIVVTIIDAPPDVGDIVDEPDLTPPPQLHTAVIQETAHALRISFDRPSTRMELATNEVFLCEEYSVFAVATLAKLHAGTSTPGDPQTRAECLWTSTTELLVRFGPGYTLKGGDTISLVGGAVRSTPTSLLFTSGFITVTGRTQPGQIVSARFSNVGNSLTVTFTGPNSMIIGTGSSGPCSTVFEEFAALGVAATCSWISKQVMTVTLGVQATLVPAAVVPDLPPGSGTVDERCLPGHRLTLKSGGFRPVANSVLSAEGCVTVGGPLSPPTPVATFSAPAILGSCDNLVLDASLSSGGAGRSMTYVWDVQALNTRAQNNLATIRSYTNTATQNNAAVITIPRGQVRANAEFQFTLTLSNFLNPTAVTRTKRVRKVSLPIPYIAIEGSDSRLNFRSQLLLLRGIGYSPTCSEGDISPAMSFGWSVINTTTHDDYEVHDQYEILPLDLQAPEVVALRSGTPKVLRVPPHMTRVGHLYHIRFEGWMVDDPTIRSSADVEVFIPPDVVKAQIQGGDRVVGAEVPLVLDAFATTVDRDRIDYVPFRFSWSCVAPEQPFFNVTTEEEEILPESDCYLFSGELIDFSNFVENGTFGGKLVLPPATIRGGSSTYPAIYQFTVEAVKGDDSNPIPAHTRRSTETVEIRVIDGAPPVPQVAPLAKLKVNPGTPLVLEGSVDSRAPETLEVQWTVVGVPDPVSFFASHHRELAVTTSSTAMQPGATYSFRLTAIDDNGEAYTQVVVSANRPPTSGFVDVTPRSGIAAIDEFEFRALQWTDDTEDLPLRYMMAYVVEGRVSGAFGGGGIASDFETGDDDDTAVELNAEFRLSAFSYDSHASALLPASEADGGTLLAVAYIRDILDAETRSSAGADGEKVRVTVSELVVTESERIEVVQNAAANRMAIALQEGNNEQFVADLAVYTSVLNTQASPCDGVDCGDHGQCDGGECVCSGGYSGDACTVPPPPVNGGLTPWSDWSLCDRICGGGRRERTRSCTNPVPRNGGLDCAGPLVEAVPCSEHECPPEPIHGGYADWSEWGACSAATCAEGSYGVLAGTRVRSRTCTSPAPSPTGHSCAILGEPIQETTCSVTCPAPLKRCPGRVVTAGIGIGSPTVEQFCSGHGECRISKQNCRVDEPCTATCACQDGWGGQDCSLSAAELQVRMQTRAILVQGLSSAVQATDATSASLEQQARALSELADPSQLADETKDDVVELTSTLLDRASGLNSQARLSGEPIESLSPMLSFSLASTIGTVFADTQAAAAELRGADGETDGEDDGKDGEGNGEDGEGGYSQEQRRQALSARTAELRDMVDQLSLGMTSADIAGGPAKHAETEYLKLSVSKVNAGQLSSATTASQSSAAAFSSFPPDTLGARSDGVGQQTPVNVKMAQWGANPHTGEDDTSIDTGVVSTEIVTESGVVVRVNELDEPLELCMPIPTSIPDEEFKCIAFDDIEQRWKTNGLAVTGFRSRGSARYGCCASTHLTDFGGIHDDIKPAFPPDVFFKSAGELTRLLDPENLFTLIMMGSLVGIFTVAYIVALVTERCERSAKDEFRRDHFMQHGIFKVVDPYTLRARHVPFRERLGHVLRVAWLEFRLLLRIHHSWAHACAPRDKRLHVTRPQGVIVVLASCFAAMAANALWFGKEPQSLESTMILGVFSGAMMFPCEKGFPMLFKRANTLKSLTLAELKQKIRNTRSNMRRADSKDARQLKETVGAWHAKPQKKNAIVPMPADTPPSGGAAWGESKDNPGGGERDAKRGAATRTDADEVRPKVGRMLTPADLSEREELPAIRGGRALSGVRPVLAPLPGKTGGDELRGAEPTGALSGGGAGKAPTSGANPPSDSRQAAAAVMLQMAGTGDGSDSEISMDSSDDDGADDDLVARTLQKASTQADLKRPGADSSGLSSDTDDDDDGGVDLLAVELQKARANAQASGMGAGAAVTISPDDEDGNPTANPSTASTSTTQSDSADSKNKVCYAANLVRSMIR